MNADHIPIVNIRRPTLILKDLPFERYGNFMYWINHMTIISISYALFIWLKSEIELE